MNFALNKSLEILERTPKVLEVLLKDLSQEWIMNNEGEDTWSAYDIVGHFLHGEKTDWLTRTKIILATEGNKTFAPFDRFAQFTESKGKDLNQLLKEFKEARNENLKKLKALSLSENDLDKKGIHPAFGDVTLQQLLSTWTVHDLAHMSQINRVLAKQYKENVGPWVEYLSILK